jgi:gamma-glutamylcyclotransferase (GGCT)/AIG2-like uncharacterized protein YtfP
MKKNLAVYGTLRNFKTKKGKVDGFSLIFPAMTRAFPAAIKDNNESIVVEVKEIEDYEIGEYDKYENVRGGLYKRENVNVDLPDDKKVEAWMYVAGPVIMQDTGVYEKIKDNDWENVVY